MRKEMLTRFAPSPTGLMHLGNVRAALICYLYAKKMNGQFILRIDDTNTDACKAEYIDYIKRDLTWLGITWDNFFQQSTRFDRYQQVFNDLRKTGRIYECYETAEELEIKRKLLISRGLPQIYDRAALYNTDQQIAKYQSEGRKPYFRFKINVEDTISWYDQIRGEITFIGANLSDPVVMRTNGLYTYMLPSIIDDIDHKITHVVRGEDHIANTAIQIQMMEALNTKTPTFAHLSLLNIEGNKLSKREGSLDVNQLRMSGIEPMAINSYLATIGSSNPISYFNTLDELIQNFDIEKFSSGSVTLNIDDINHLNHQAIRNMPFNVAYQRLNIQNLTAEFWDAIKFNITNLTEVSEWWKICKTDIKPIIENKDLIKAAYENLPSGTWGENTWNAWITKLKEITNHRGKELFMPLRLALTANKSGPELAKLLPLIGRKLVEERLQHYDNE